MKTTYAPEGSMLYLPENQEYISSLSGLEKAFVENKTLESTVLLCDSALRLHVSLGDIRGIIEYDDSVFCRAGESIKEIAVITRVGKPVAFKIKEFRKEYGKTVAILSRRAAQEECQKHFLATLSIGDIIPAKVTHLENFGAFVDVGCGLSSLLTVDNISVSRISHPSDRLSVGDEIYVVVKSRDEASGRIYVSMKELLGTWQENADLFEVGQTVSGIIRSVEDYGVFVELAPNLAGLAEIREDTKDREIAKVGSTAAVYIKSIIPDKMKIKLILIDSYKGAIPDKKPRYFINCKTSDHISHWKYSPPFSSKTVESIFE